MTLRAVPAVSVVTETTTRVERIGLARDDLLQVRDHLRRDRDRVDGLVRVRAVAAAPLDLEREQVGGRHHRPGRAARHDPSRARRAGARRRRGRRRRARRASTMSRAPPGGSSSACWKTKRTSPASSSRRSTSSCAAPSSIAVWPSCPQACITPGRVDACGMHVLLVDRQRVDVAPQHDDLARPGAVKRARRRDVPAGRSISRPPNERRVSSMNAEVSCSSNDSSGLACRCRRHAIARASRSSETRREPGTVVAIGTEATGNVGRAARVVSRDEPTP